MDAFLIVFDVLVVVAFLILASSIKVVRQSTVVIVERLGKFHKVLDAGIHLIVPFLDRASKPISFVNKECKLLESISPTQPGSVKINGVTWTVIADSDDKEIPADTMVVVEEVKGNKLVVKVKGE